MKLLWKFGPTEKLKAEREARRFDYARRCNGLPLLVVQEYEDGWGIFSPDPNAIAQPYRTPDERE